MQKYVKILTCGIVLIFVLAGCSTLPTMPKRPKTLTLGDYGYTKEYITWLIRKEMSKHHVTGLSVALVDDQKVVWAEGFGFADKAENILATPDTVYRVGSISKLFTATATMQLMEQGKLDIDKPVQTFLPEFSIKSRFSDAGPITPRTIMTHHSGLPSDLRKGMWTKNPEPFENDVNILKEEYVAYPPNFVYSYSNLGVTILGQAIEKISGQDFSAYMDASILNPLGMSHSKFSAAPDRSPLGAKAYGKSGKAEELPLRDVPAGGLNSTVLDLSRFMQMVFAEGRANDRQIVKPETLTEMLHPQNAEVPLDLDFHIGLGWMLSAVDIRNAGTVASHNGATLYHRSQLIVLPDHKLGVVVLANTASARSVVSNVATETLKLALEAKTGIRQTKRKKVEEGKISLSPDSLQAYMGHYATTRGSFVTITQKSDYLGIEDPNASGSWRFVSRADGLLYLQHKLFGLFSSSLGALDNIGFSFAKVGNQTILKAHYDGREFLAGERIESMPIPEKWSRRTGEYDIVNRGDDAYTVLFDGVRLKQDADQLLFFNGPYSIAIAPLSDTEAVTCGMWRSMGETIRMVTVDGEELIQYSGYLFKKKKNWHHDE